MFKMVKENDMFYSVYFTDVYASYIYSKACHHEFMSLAHTHTHTNKYANFHQSLITQ